MTSLLRGLFGLALTIGLAWLAVSASAQLPESASAEGAAGAEGPLRLGDNDRGARLFSLASARPGARRTGCIAVSYSGSSRAVVGLYAEVSGPLARYLRLTVTRGTDQSPKFPSCAAFSADRSDYIGAGPGVIYAGRLSDYPSSAATALTDPGTGSGHAWKGEEAHSYRVSISLVDDNAAQGLSARWSFMWRAEMP